MNPARHQRICAEIQEAHKKEIEKMTAELVDVKAEQLARFEALAKYTVDLEAERDRLKESATEWNWDDALSLLRAKRDEKDVEPVALDAIYAAWHGAGIDILGGDWTRFVGMLPPLYTHPAHDDTALLPPCASDLEN